jgi:hypothetical protein
METWCLLCLMQIFRFGLNHPMMFGEDDLIVEYYESNLMVLVRCRICRRVFITRCLLSRFMLSIPFARTRNSPLLILLAEAVHPLSYMIAQSKSSTVVIVCRLLMA